ncbi:MAG: V-type ATP synthase subunit D [Candidatus Thermoplasmatota archaeon]|jgi:V/A-type H+-transporting ATPase subunit D|nr:V-type ATP synthase subunit D [Candidatus Thermoplasmatota archaeon]
MPSMEIRPTRIELIKLRRRIKLSKRGLDLLKMKRSALVMEFLKLAAEIRGLRENLRKDVEGALNSMVNAEIASGMMTIERIAYMSGESNVGIKPKNVMGVRIPVLNIDYEKAVLSEQYRALSVPIPVDEAISKFEKLFKSLINVAEKENSMRRLLHEIDRTKRRSNAIENILIPNLNAQAKYIRMRLDEMERDTFTTLKIVKKKITSGDID